MAIPLLGVVGKMICAFVLLFVFGCYDISNWGTLAVLGSEHEVQPVYHYSRGRSSLMMGLMIGWGLGYLVTVVLAAHPAVMLATSLGVALLLAVALAIVPYGSDHLAMLKAKDEHDAHDGSGHDMGSWTRRCLEVAQRSGLTPREQEVMVLLAKGRNAAHIQQDLFISSHTAKTHIYRVYRKLGVKRQQELIDLVENKSARRG
ncbi:MAG: response regulator transcription factor [Coriobacteriia bacterium]